MIYIETGSTDVYYNFGLENYFTVKKRLPDTVFLFWRTTPTLMVGKYQNVLEEINKPYADAHGIHLVRRMSGGGTIYTDLGGWQFSFIQHKEAGEIEFGQYIAPVIGALGEMGVRASFNGRNDLTIDGRKFSGSAQYRLGDCIVHHGSLLFDTDIRQMAEATTPDSYKITSKSIKSVRDRVTNISDHLPVPMDPETFKETHGAPYHERQHRRLHRHAGGRRPHPGDRPGAVPKLGADLRQKPQIHHRPGGPVPGRQNAVQAGRAEGHHPQRRRVRRLLLHPGRRDHRRRPDRLSL